MIRKILTATIAATLGAATVSYAASGPTVFPHGIASSAPVVTPEGVTQGTIGDAVTQAQGSVQKSTVNVANGVAGLDDNGSITSPINTKKAVISSDNGHLVELVNQRNDPLLGEDTLLFGGIPNEDGYSPGAPITLMADPFGNYNNGCVLCLAMSTEGYGSSAGRAAVTQGDWRGGIGSIQSENAAVGLYEYAENKKPRLIVDVAYYTATSIVLKKPLTDSQISRIRPGMYIAINSIDNTIPYDSNNESKGTEMTTRFYQSFTSLTPLSSDGKTINVIGWKSPASGNNATGQVPHPNIDDYNDNTDVSGYFDTQSFNYTKPVAFLGGPNTVFGRNLYMNYDGSRFGSGPGGNDSTSTVKTLVGEEIDLTASNMTKQNQFKYYGLTISTPLWTCLSGVSSCGTTKDSAGEIINVQLAHALVAQCGGDCVPLSGEGYYIHSDKGVQTVGTNTPNTTWELNENYGWVDGTSRATLINYLSKDKPEITGIAGASMHISLQDNAPKSSGNIGNDWGSIVFNELGNNNAGVSLCGGSANSTVRCGVSVDYSNNVNIMGNVTVNSGKTLSLSPLNEGSEGHPYLFADGSNSINIEKSSGGNADVTAGNIKATGANISGTITINPTDISNGAPFFYASTFNEVNFKTTSGSPVIISTGSVSAANDITASGILKGARLILPTGTPTTSSDTCTQGQVESDAAYIYTCVATNTWHRVSNGATW